MSKQQDHNPFEDAINESVNKLSRVAPSAVLYNSLLWAAVAFVTIIGFNILRPKNKIIYEPKVKYHTGGKTPPKISDGFFSWLPPLIHTKEPELLDKVGLDAITFLRFLRMMRWLFTGLSILLFAGVVPVNITQSMKRPPNKRDALSILTIRDVFGSLLYVHIGAVYVVTFIVFGFVWWHWKHMVRLRNEWFASDEYQKSFYARTLMVTDVPRKMHSDEGLTSLFASMQMPYPTTSVHIGRHVGRLPELVNHHNETVRELEEHLVRYLKGGKIGKKRPTFTKGGCMGCGGQKTDAIDFYTAKLKKTEGAIEQWRNEIDTRKAENYGFASLAAVPYAHVVARMFAGKTIKGTTVTMAPNPKDIIWTNLNMSPAERARKRTMGWVWLSAFAALNTFPLLLVSFFANLNALMIYVKPLRDWANASEFTFSLASAVLPPTLSAIFGWLQPVVMRYLSRYQGATTHTRLDRAVVARYFAFLVISQLIIFSLIGVIFNGVSEIMQAVQQQLSFQEIIDNLNQLPPTIPQTYISQSNYWLTFFPLRGFLAIFDLAQIINLVWTSFKTRVFGRTPRDVLEWTQPPEFEYAIYYSNLLFMGTVGLVFAPFAPLVTVGAALVFWVSSVVYKYQLMFVFITRVESGGRLWNVIINRLLFSLILMQLLMTLTIGLRLEFKSWIWTATLPPLVFVVGFKWWLTYTFDQKFRYYLPSEEAIRNSQVHSANADSKGHRLEKRFGHPALYADLFTPMVHAKMAHLLPQVYHGNLGSDTAVMDEYDGRKMEAQILPGGIRIAAINQQDLEFDPALYGRDRGELDWDTRSVASVNMLHEVRDKMQVPLTRIQSYLSHGPRPSMGLGRRGAAPGQGQGGGDPIELSRIDSRSDAWPLLQNNSSIPGGIDTPGQMTPYHEIPHQYPPSSYDLSRSGTPVQQRSITPQGHRPMTPSQSGHGHYRPPSQQLLQSPAAYGGAQPGQVIAPGQMPPQYHQRGRSTETLGQYGAPPQQQPHHRGLSIDTLGQYGAQRPGTPGSYHERLPSANGPGGDYFGPARGASPHSPHGQQHQRMGTPTQQHPPQGWSPHSARSPSVDQLRQHQPSPGAGGYRR